MPSFTPFARWKRIDGVELPFADLLEHELGDPVPHGDGERLLPIEVDEVDEELPPVPRIDGAGRIDDGDPVPRGETGARMDETDPTARQREANPRRNQGALTGCEADLGDRGEVCSGVTVLGVAGHDRIPVYEGHRDVRSARSFNH